MSTHETIEQQARREAEARYPYAIPGVLDDWERRNCINGYAAALIAERSKPQPSVNKAMEVVNEEVSHEPDRWRVLARLTKLFNK